MAQMDMVPSPHSTQPRQYDADELNTRLDGFARLLHACVHADASIGFVLPFSMDDAARFWRVDVMPTVAARTRLLFAVEGADGIMGTVQLDPATRPNQPHRAEVMKLLVHPAARRRGLARALLAELERQALTLGRTLLTLDTRTGDTAEPLYESLGYCTVGVIPGYALDPSGIDKLDATTIMYKTLE